MLATALILSCIILYFLSRVLARLAMSHSRVFGQANVALRTCVLRVEYQIGQSLGWRSLPMSFSLLIWSLSAVIDLPQWRFHLGMVD